MQTHPTVFELFPRIQNPAAPGAVPFFGGDQRWYSRYTRLYSGCGPVAAANMVTVHARGQGCARALGLPDNPTGLITYGDFLLLMDKSYMVMSSFEVPVLNRLMDARHEQAGRLRKDGGAAQLARAARLQNGPVSKLPPSFGNSLFTFVRGTKALGASFGLALSPAVFHTHLAPEKTALAFIRQQLAAGSPVALLTRFNHHPVALYPKGLGGQAVPSEIKRPHFLTVAGLEENETGPALIVSTWGQAGRIPMAALAKSWRSPGAVMSALIAFSPLS